VCLSRVTTTQNPRKAIIATLPLLRAHLMNHRQSPSPARNNNTNTLQQAMFIRGHTRASPEPRLTGRCKHPQTRTVHEEVTPTQPNANLPRCACNKEVSCAPTAAPHTRWSWDPADRSGMRAGKLVGYGTDGHLYHMLLASWGTVKVTKHVRFRERAAVTVQPPDPVVPARTSAAPSGRGFYLCDDIGCRPSPVPPAAGVNPSCTAPDVPAFACRAAL
jgi:hypothetical protein